jgi:uncharacterized membrane protein YhiD involved in acid resistance
MAWTDFATRLALALIFGATTSLKRPWRESFTLLKTNVSVSLCMSIFVMTAVMTAGETNLVGIAGQIVLVIGGIGAIVILSAVKTYSTNQLLTLWYGAGVGAMVGFGFYHQAYIAVVTIFLANWLFPSEITSQEHSNFAYDNRRSRLHKPSIGEAPATSVPQKAYYRCHLVCDPEHEANALSKLVQLLKPHNLMLTAVKNKPLDNQNSTPGVEITADFLSLDGEQPLSVLEKAAYRVSKKVTICQIHIAQNSTLDAELS